MQVKSVNLGKPQIVEWRGKKISTAIFKSPVKGKIQLNVENFEGDQQADLTVHGGVDKAVYTYPYEHYAFWQSELPDYQLVMGNFGENLTTTGLLESEVRLGDIFKIGSVKLMAVQPRMPCFKLGIRFGNEKMVKKFWEAQKNGIYFRVIETGQIEKGDLIQLIEQSPENLTILDVVKVFTTERENRELLKKLVNSQFLAESLKGYLLQILSR